MANDREFSVILKATDLSTQPIQQVLEAVKRLTEAQKQNNEAAAQGSITAKEFGDGLKTLLAGAQSLTGAQTALQRFLDQQKLVAERLNAVAAAQAKLDAKRAEVAPGAEPSDKQAAAIQRLEKALASAQGRSDSANASLETLRTSLDKMGVAADLSDKRAGQLGNAREKALQAVLVAQEKLDAKIASSPAEGERTKAQEYSIRRLADALTNAQTKAEQARTAFESYQNVKLNEAVVQAQGKIREGIEATIPVVQRANVETLSLTENRNKAAAAAAAQAEIEKRTAAEIEAASREAIAARDVQNRQAIAAEDERINALVGAAARQKELYDADQRARQENYNRELAQVKEQEAADGRLAKKREADAKEQQKFQQASYAQLFTPVLDQADAEEKNRIERDKAAKQEQIEAEKALAAARVAESHRAVEAEDARIAALVGARDRVFTITEEERAAREKAYNEEQAAVARLAAAQKKAAEDEVKFRRDQKQAQYENLFTPVHEADLEAVKRQKAAEDDLAKARAKAALEQQARLEALRESQGKIGDAIARTPGTQPLGVSVEPPANFSNLSAQLQSILAPAEAARQTIGGVAKQIAELGAVLEGPKLRTEDYDNKLRSLGASLMALQRLGGLVDTYRAQEAATIRLGAALDKEKSTRDAMTTLYARTKVYDEQQVTNINRQVALVAKLSTEFNRENESLAGLRNGLEAAGINFQFLDVEIQRLAQTAEKGKVIFDGLKANSSSAGKEFSFLGLRPYELQNLSYQINDVFTQLGSGTPITQVFAQQSGQIFQLFQLQLVSVLKSLRDIPFAISGLSVAAGLAVFGIMALVRALDLAAARRQFQALSDLDPDKIGRTAAGMQLAALAAERLGVSFADASKGASEFAKAGFSDAQTKQYLLLAAQLASARNVPIADVVKGMIAALRGGYDDVHKFNIEIARLTEAEDEHIRKLLEGGKQEEARLALLQALSPAAQKAYQDSLTASGRAWQSLINTLHSGEEDWSSFWDRQWSRVIRGAENTIKVLKMVGEANRKTLLEYDPETGAPVTTGFPQPSTAQADKGLAERQQTVMQNIMKDLQLTREQAAGIVGQLSHESGLQAVQERNPKDGGRGGFGWAQWTAERRTQFEDFAKQNNLALTSDEANYKFLLQELRGSKAAVLADIRKQTTVEGATRAAFPYESGAAPGKEDPRMVQAPESRLKFAQQAYAGSSAQSAEVQKVEEATNRAAIATRNWERAENERRVESEKGHGTEIEQLDNLEERVKLARRRVQESAQKAGVAEGTDIGQTAIRRQQDEEEKRIREDFLRTRQEQEVEAQGQLNEVRQRVLKADKTNLQERLDATREYYDKLGALISQREREGKAAPRGISYEQYRVEIAQTEQRERQNVAVDVAQEITKDVVEQRTKAIEAVRALNLSAKETSERITETLTQFGPKVRDAVQRSDAILRDQVSKGFDSPQIQLQLQRNQTTLAQANRPQEAVSTLQTAGQQAESEVNSRVSQNKAQLDVITDSVKVGGAQASDAIARIVEFGKSSVTGLRDLVNTQRTQLEAIRDNPITNESERQKIQTELDRNQLASSQAAIDVENAIRAVLADDKQRLDKAMEEYKKAVTDLDNKIRDGRLSPLQAAAERARIDAENIPKIAQLGQTYRADTKRGQQGAEQLGLSPGFRADLSAEAQRAATESDPRTLNSQSQKDNATQLLASAKQAQSITIETARTQADLLRMHATTQTAAEAAVKDAFAQANAELDKQAPAIEKLIQEMEAVGNTQGAKKLAADWALVRAQMQYIDPLTQQIIQGFEQSFVSHATQAFDTIAKSIADVAVHGGKLKDVWSAVGQGFASMTAGILSDIAKIIIKYELLKLINNALGTNIPTGAAGGSSGSSAGSTAGGLGSIFGALLGSSASSTFGTTAASAAGAVSADTILEAAPMAAGIILAHTGATVGTPGGMSKVVDLSVFREAQRYHSGGPVLASDEVPIIAQRGEKIVSLAQQRQEQAAASAQTNGTGGTSIRNVLAVGDKEIANAMNTPHGEKVVLNILQRNAPTVKKYVG